MAGSELAEVLLKRSKRGEVAQAALEHVKAQDSGSLPSATLRVSRAPGHLGGSNAPHGDFAYELALPYLAAYAAAGQQADVVVSADPFITFPSANFLASKGIKVIREKDDALAKRAVPLVVNLVQGSEHTKEEVLAWLRQHLGAARSKL
eukprot:TRINITY_DN47676_c0_g1_i1.p1 TRINITY_DN47676_c0_g1~~TRINITY_DN47676_c0_g1_i1.p1  ORF type:complete len:167 (-),score=33.08 TRINITY_DN47676_c0_g1_i1:7-453(-)